MRPLSIFSFDTYQARWRVASWAIFLVIFLMAGELLLRMPAVRAALPAPEPTLWHATLIQAKLDYLKSFQHTQGIDVLFIGNSAMQSAVDPALFDELRHHTSNGQAGSFNAAIEGLPPYGMRLFLEIYARYTLPKTVVYGITPQDLNSNSPWAKDVMERVKSSPMPYAEARRGVRGWFTAAMLKFSELYRYRFLLHQMFLRGGQPPTVPEVYFDQRGFLPLQGRLSEVPDAQRTRFYGKAGVMNYSPLGVQRTELLRLIEFCKDRSIELVIVNLPIADQYYNNFDDITDYDLYLTNVKQITDVYDIPFWNLEDLPSETVLGDDDFSDLNHLNYWGAEKLTKLIAERLGVLGEHSANRSSRR